MPTPGTHVALQACLSTCEPDLLSSQNIGNTTSPSIWPLIRQLWVETLEAHTLPDLDATTTRLLADVVVSLAKFTRNLVAANEDYQAKA